MMSEISDVTQVSDTLKGVEIAIGFLSSTGGDAKLSYLVYLKDILHMNVDKYLPSAKVSNTVLPYFT